MERLERAQIMSGLSFEFNDDDFEDSPLNVDLGFLDGEDSDTTEDTATNSDPDNMSNWLLD